MLNYLMLYRKYEMINIFCNMRISGCIKRVHNNIFLLWWTKRYYGQYLASFEQVGRSFVQWLCEWDS